MNIIYAFPIFLFSLTILGSEISKSEPIIISTNKTSPRIKPDSTQIVEVIEKEEIEQLQPQSLQDVLVAVPGTNTQGGPRKQAQVPQIRGLDNKKVLVLIDRLRQDFRTQQNGAFFFDPFMWKRVEIIKGPSSVLYGNGALGGVLSIESKDARDFLDEGKDGERDGQGGVIGVNHRSASDSLLGMGALYKRVGPVDGLVAFSRGQNENIRLGNGEKLRYSADRNHDFITKWGYELSPKQNIRLNVEDYQSSTIAPISPQMDVQKSNYENMETSSDKIVRRQVAVGHNSLMGDHEEGESHLLMYRQQTKHHKNRLGDHRYDVREFITYGVDYYQQWKTGLGKYCELSRLTMGGEYFEDRIQGTRDSAPLPDFPKGIGKNESLFAQYQHAFIPEWLVVGGVRYGAFQVKSDNKLLKKRQGENWSKKMGTEMYPFFERKLKIFYSYSEGWNAPRLQELFPEGEHFGGISFFKPNPDLRPEGSRQHETGFRVDSDGVIATQDVGFLQYTLFRERIQNYIGDYINLENGDTSFRNIGDIELKGHEITGGYDIDRLSAKVSFSQIRGKNKTNGNLFDKAPADEWKFQFDYRLIDQELSLGYLGVLAYKQHRVNDQARFEAQHEFQQLEGQTAGYFVHDAYINWSPKMNKQERVEIQLRAHNLTDKAYRQHGSLIMSQGRDIRIGVRRYF